MILRVIKAEGLKLKKICWWIPLIQGCVLTGMTAVEWYLYFRQGPGGVYAGFAVMFMFLSFVMLLGGTLLASIMVGTEHDTQTWKQLYHACSQKLYLFIQNCMDRDSAVGYRLDHCSRYEPHLGVIYKRTHSLADHAVTAD